MSIKAKLPSRARAGPSSRKRPRITNSCRLSPKMSGKVSPRFLSRLHALAAHPIVGEARGVGLIGVTLSLTLGVLLGGISGLEVVKRIVERSAQTRVLVLTMHEETQYWERVMAAGAHGFVMKRDAPGQLLEAMRTVLAGSLYYSEQVQRRLAQIARDLRRASPTNPLDALSEKELDVLRMIGRGMGTSEIAVGLSRSVKTIETHKANLKTKLGMDSSRDLTTFAMRWAVDTGDESFGRPDGA